MLRLIIYGIGTLLSLLLIVNPPVQSQIAPPSEPLRVATRIIPPFVIQEPNKLTGFSIELWEAMRQELGITSTFSIYHTITDLLAAVELNKTDLAIAAISITAERDQKFDFSQPIFESGLQILVRSQSKRNNLPLNFLGLFTSRSFLDIIVIICIITLIPAHIIWFFERRREDSIISTQAYFPGIFKALWWSVATLATQADEMPKGVIGRIIATIWMFTSVVFVAYFTATVTTSLTVQQLQGNIQSSEDLPGKLVSTIAGSTSADYLREHNIQILERKQINQVYEDLLTQKVDAVVFDAPVLLYYAAHEGKGKVEVVGTIFQRENYGILLPLNSPYRKSINNTLLKLQETGIYQDLYDKWFTSKP